jgi:hypothetical protein
VVDVELWYHPADIRLEASPFRDRKETQMVCEHLKQLYQLCLDQKIRLSASDLIHVVCEQCGRKEVCPSNLRTDREEDAEVRVASGATPRGDGRA